MNGSDPRDGEAAQAHSQSGLKDWAVGLLLTESVALAIALVTPVTPSRTGSTWSPAELFWTDPSYLQEVAADFVLVNVLILVLGVVAWLVITRGRRR